MRLHWNSVPAWLLLATLHLSGIMPAVVLGADFDVLIRNGRLLDGSGAPWRYADIGIRDDRIVEVGNIPTLASSGLVIDADGRYVAPGFIDAHSHAAEGLETAERANAESLLR